jgi:hypothetical protein
MKRLRVHYENGNLLIEAERISAKAMIGVFILIMAGGSAVDLVTERGAAILPGAESSKQ